MIVRKKQNKSLREKLQSLKNGDSLTLSASNNEQSIRVMVSKENQVYRSISNDASLTRYSVTKRDGKLIIKNTLNND